jgi:nitrite reductase (NADH) small subunit
VSAAPQTGDRTWVEVCGYDDLLPERGVAALVGGQQVALFRLADGSVHAVGHHDPFSGANVMARGIVGTRGDVDTVASPVYKQVFAVRTGECLDDDSVRLPCWPVEVVDGRVRVRTAALPATTDRGPATMDR